MEDDSLREVKLVEDDLLAFQDMKSFVMGNVYDVQCIENLVSLSEKKGSMDWISSMKDEEEDVSLDMEGEEKDDDILLEDNIRLEASPDDYVENGDKPESKEGAGTTDDLIPSGVRTPLFKYLVKGINPRQGGGEIV
ncbi:hypothetical protein L1987_06449 [Smallanthus sonchifolius]|uniref:Uncharacterized protein n=1 Tax=Smallanthus sonchifolius TaxID=185202 RepID=A0ACB9JYF1_9ASTR|nr:hypothetical protein L1987_06449 [Smallanthus sonchifolius]